MAVRIGEVVTTFPERHTVKVKFVELDDVISSELTVLNHVDMPKVHDEVVCLMKDKSDGFIAGIIPSNNE